MFPRARMLRMVACLLIAASPAVASARQNAAGEPDDKIRDEARELVYRGDELFAQKKYAEALRAYQRAETLIRVPTTSIEVAKTLSAIGRLSEARDLAAAIDSSRAAPDEPWPFTQARRRADALRDDLADRIPRLRVNITPAAVGARLRVDGQEVKPSAEGSLIDPGNHWIEVEADGYLGARQRVYVPERDVTTVDVPLTKQPGSPTTPWVVGGFITSGAGLALGLGAGAAYLSARSDLEDACRRGAADCSRDTRSSANAVGRVSNVGFGLAVAGAAVGGLALVLDAKAPSSAVTWAVGPGYIGVRGTL
ncbi:hypothetical protein SOCE26_076200 [Sorangium cellulosum]|uniref:Uncharacterized protein n=1 Tax=Sorangium cellulosum TaxID=56 RepID=A0A2L0F3G7_SORCE|nr:PEGA domain-containing protein [Sorangium cellulosum]AUX46115.1 hypothetical protein SOCE26_076200 [Sorangium cellulosum]